MTEHPGKPSASARVLAALRELIGALDRRMPHSERPAETGIATDSRRLRRDAVARIEELTRADAANAYDQDLVQAIMSDDGGPSAGRPSRKR